MQAVQDLSVLEILCVCRAGHNPAQTQASKLVPCTDDLYSAVLLQYTFPPWCHISQCAVWTSCQDCSGGEAMPFLCGHSPVGIHHRDDLGSGFLSLVVYSLRPAMLLQQPRKTPLCDGVSCRLCNVNRVPCKRLQERLQERLQS